jgi:hypothetical protein
MALLLMFLTLGGLGVLANTVGADSRGSIGDSALGFPRFSIL